MNDNLTVYQKQSISLYYWMLGKGYMNACKAFNYAKKIHDGTRKDGVTPEFSHQIWIACYIRTLNIGHHDMEIALASALLHDTLEDKMISKNNIFENFGQEITSNVILLSKKFALQEPNDKSVSYLDYFENLSNNAIAALVKGVDRLHNLSTMKGVFSAEKQNKYIEETKGFHLPMIKKARLNFPEFEQSYENIKLNIKDKLI